MSKSWKRLALVAGTAALMPWAARADDFVLRGVLEWHSQIAQWQFSVGHTVDVSMWTVSHLNGRNFDPLLTVWNADDGSFIAQGDDINPGANGFDARIDLAGLAAGRYLVTLTASPNARVGDRRQDGFMFDTLTPHSISTWCQPAALACGAGGQWQAMMSGVDSVGSLQTITPVPEPAAALLMLAGLAGLGAWSRRRSTEVVHARA